MRKVSKIATAAAGLLLAGGAAAAAVTAPPDAADQGLSTAEGHTGIELPASHDEHPTADDHPGGGSESVETAQGEHGAAVSAVAQDDATSAREHGEAVSEVARGEHGQASADAAIATPNGGLTGTADEASEGASEAGTGQAAEQAAGGAGNAGDHGQP